jgi:hypothetical protein
MIKKLLVISILLFKFSLAQSDSLLIFSEIMFSPVSGNNEFIEIYNLSSTELVDLSNYKIKYYSSAADQIVDAGFGTTLLPKSYAIIFENDYDITGGIYKALVPSTALILKIDDNSFGSTGMANSSNRPLWLLSAANDTVDYYFYSANNGTGISDEKIILNHDSLQTNWANSLVANGTPGFTNSVTPINYDIEISSLSFSPQNPFAGDDVSVNLIVKNKGILSASDYSVELFNDVNKDSIIDDGELIFSQIYSNLPTNDSVLVSTTLNSLEANAYQIIAQVNFTQDENLANNKTIKQFTVFPPGNSYNDIVINEIMYAPLTGEPEWIELYNKTSDTINIKNWKLSDANSTITLVPQNPSDDIIIPANSFFVITKDAIINNYYSIPSEVLTASIPSLNNTGDAVVIRDIYNQIIDSVYYHPIWGGNVGGKSLERINANLSSNDSTNWSTSKSIFKATPGNINSVTQKDFDLMLDNIQFDPKFPLLSDNVKLFGLVKNIGKILI